MKGDEQSRITCGERSRTTRGERSRTMKIDGKLLAAKVLDEIRTELPKLPPLTLAIVTLGPEDAWQHYVNQKIKLGKELGIETRLINLKDPTEEKLIKTIEKLNKDREVTGIIVQRPLTRHIQGEKITYAVTPKKDIDGFIKNAFFLPPVWLAIKGILSEIFRQGLRGSTPGVDAQKNGFLNWLKDKNITVLGKGETAGQPAIEGFIELGVKPLIIDSKTENKKEILKNSDIIVSAVGKSDLFKAEDLKLGAIVIGIGLHRDGLPDEALAKLGKLKPDFDEEEVSKVAEYYTPTPGGVGPLNLAYLFENLINAAKMAID